MDFKQILRNLGGKSKEILQTGKIQRSLRITYDVVWNVILFFLIIGVVGLFFGVGIGAGYFASLVKDEPIRSAQEMEKSIYNYEETSKLYFANNVYFADVQADLHREETSLDNVSEHLINAVIATEDQQFREHNGVVPKAIVRAIAQEALNSDTKSGGSTLTQQLIKNQILTNEVSFDRKAKEILLALRLEKFFSKDQIIEAYLNVIPYGRDASGRNIAGIQTAAKGVFGISAKKLNIPQAAYLAGMPQNPYSFTPFKVGGGVKSEEGISPGINRMKTVLKRMHDEKYITTAEYKEALDYDITADFAKKKTSPTDKYGYLNDELKERAIKILTKILAEKDGYSEEDLNEDHALYEKYRILGERDLKMKGYHIYSTIDKEIYDAFQEVAKNYQHYGPDRTIQVEDKSGKKVNKVARVQTGGMLIENSTGKIISFVGGRDYDEYNFNFATQAHRQTGSTIKSILDYAPAIDMGILHPGTPVADIDLPVTVPGQKPHTPKNYNKSRYYGLVSAREALAKSYNVSAYRTYSQIINENPVHQYLDKMNFNNLVEGDYFNLSMALGALKNGATVLENTNAFATLANQGKYAEGYMIEKITTKDGEVIYEHKPEPVEVYSPQAAYLTVDMMRDVLSYGTATFLRPQLKNKEVDWAGKTGTTNDYWDAWFIASNPNVTMGTWIGYNENLNLDYCPGCSYSYSQRNQKLWTELINAATEINPDLLAPKNKFKQPEGIVSKTICAISGDLPSELCKKAGLLRTDLFYAKYVPTKVDDSLISGSFVAVDGKSVPAGANTPKEFVKGDGYTFNPEFLKRKGYDKLKDLTQLFPSTNRDRWEKIGVPRGSVGSALTDDGSNPSTPTALKASGNTLSWNKASGHVVGYRIYHAKSTDGSLRLVGSTTSTNMTLSNLSGVFYVKAVNYFGRESSISKPFKNGKVTPPVDKDKSDEKNENNDQNTKHNNGNDNQNNDEDDSDQDQDQNHDQDDDSITDDGD